MRLHTGLTLIICLTLGVQTAFAQQSPTSGIRTLVFPIQDLSPTEASQGYQSTITDAVRAAFSGQGYSMIVEAAWSSLAESRHLDLTGALPASDAVDVARAAGADLAVTGYYTIQNDQIHYALQCWDVGSGTLTSGIEETGPFNLAFFSALSIAMTDRLIARVSIVGKATPRVVFTSPNEGMQVLLAGELDVGRVTDGKLTFSLSSVTPGTKVVVHKVLAGYHAADQTVTLTTNKEIPLSPLVKEHKLGLELNLTSGQLLGVNATIRSYAVPDWFFITTGGAFWLQPPAQLTARVAVHKDLFMGLGGYLFLPPESPVRFGASTGVGLVTTFMSTASLPQYTDYYIDAVNVWLEAGFPGTTFFLREDLRYALGLGTNLLGQGWMSSGMSETTLGVLFKW